MSQNIVMLCGGVGGARAALALCENLPQDKLTFLVNTGDDFEHLGLEIWPDWDTVIYHLAGVNDAERGWGRADEDTQAMEEFKRLGAPDWFHLGDRDLALHVFRTWSLKQGLNRRQFAAQVCHSYGIEPVVLPLSEKGMNTQLLLQSGEVLDFQEWFVERQCRPLVSKVVNKKLAEIPLTQGVRQSLEQADILLMAPSNPYLSLGPMLAHPEVAQILANLTIPKIAVSPLIGGRAIKGPLDRLIETLSPYRGQLAIAHYWSEWVDALVLPKDECGPITESPLPLLPCPTLLSSVASRADFALHLGKAWELL